MWKEKNDFEFFFVSDPIVENGTAPVMLSHLSVCLKSVFPSSHTNIRSSIQLFVSLLIPPDS